MKRTWVKYFTVGRSTIIAAADPHRRALRPLPRCAGLQPQGHRGRPEVPGSRGALNVYALYRTHDYHFAISGETFQNPPFETHLRVVPLLDSGPIQHVEPREGTTRNVDPGIRGAENPAEAARGSGSSDGSPASSGGQVRAGAIKSVRHARVVLARHAQGDLALALIGEQLQPLRLRQRCREGREISEAQRAMGNTFDELLDVMPSTPRRLNSPVAGADATKC